MDFGLIKDFLEGKLSPVLSIILINLTLLGLIWSKLELEDDRIDKLEKAVVDLSHRIDINDLFINKEVKHDTSN